MPAKLRAMSKDAKEEKLIKKLNAKYQCIDNADSEIVPRMMKSTKSITTAAFADYHAHEAKKAKEAKKSSKPPSAWMAHLKAFYEKMKKSDPSYSYKSAMSDAKSTYTSVAKKPATKRVAKPKAPKPKPELFWAGRK